MPGRPGGARVLGARSVPTWALPVRPGVFRIGVRTEARGAAQRRPRGVTSSLSLPPSLPLSLTLCLSVTYRHRNRMVDDKGRPRYGRAYADQLKQDLAEEMVCFLCVSSWLCLCVSVCLSHSV